MEMPKYYKVKAYKSGVCLIPIFNADVAEVKHGTWQTVNEDWNVYKCSVCQHEFMLIDGEPQDNNYNFCPNCGADMRGKAEDIEECLRQMDFEAKRLTDRIDEMQAAKGAIDVEKCLRQKKERNRRLTVGVNKYETQNNK